MPVIRLSIEPTFCGPMSVGTIAHIELLREQLNLPLAVAKQLIDRCVFEGEEVEITVASLKRATALVDALRGIPGPAIVRVEVDEDSA